MNVALIAYNEIRPIEGEDSGVNEEKVLALVNQIRLLVRPHASEHRVLGQLYRIAQRYIDGDTGETELSALPPAAAIVSLDHVRVRARSLESINRRLSRTEYVAAIDPTTGAAVDLSTAQDGALVEVIGRRRRRGAPHGEAVDYVRFVARFNKRAMRCEESDENHATV